MNNSSFTETCQTVWPHQAPMGWLIVNDHLFFLWFLVAAGESELVPWAVLSSQILEKWRRTNCYVDEFCFVKPTGAGRPIRTLPRLSQRGRGTCASQVGGLTWWKSRGEQNELLMNESSWKYWIAWLGLLQEVTEIAKLPHLLLSHEPGSAFALLVIMSVVVVGG